MLEYTLRRIVLVIPVVLGVTLIVFFSIRLVPGDALLFQATESLYANEQLLERLRHDLGLDMPAYIQYFRWLGGVLHGDLGTSLFNQVSTLQQIAERLPVSFELAVLSVLVAITIAIPLGVVSALRQDNWIDYFARMLSIAGLSVPDFLLATLFIALPALWWQYHAPLGYAAVWDDPWKHVQQILPAAIAVGIRMSATVTRMTRSTMLEVLREDYIRTAWAKGLGQRLIVSRHALKNALIPVVTLLGTSFGHLIGGVVIVETVFTLPGVGFLTYRAVVLRDYTQLQANVLVMATVFVTVNLLVDLSYAWLDPRIRYR